MNGRYSLRNGNFLQVWLWNDVLDGDNWRGTVDVFPISANGTYSRNRKEVHKTVKEDEKGLYFVWRTDNNKTEKVYINDFIAMPYNDLVSKLDEAIEKKLNDYGPSNDEILAVLMKRTDEVCIQAEMPKADLTTPFGFSFFGEETVPVTCHLSETTRKKSEWGFKVTLEVDPAFCHGGIMKEKDVYFSDFCSMLRSGINYRLIKKGDK